MLPLIAAAAVPQLIKGISGIAQSAKGRRMERNNVRPTYEIPGEFQKNVALAEQMGRSGMPSQQYNNAMNNIQRNQAGGLRTLNRSANPAAGVAALVRASNDATNSLDAQDAQNRLNNQRFAFGQRGLLAQQLLAKQKYDKMDKYDEMDSKAQALIGAGRQNTFGALDGLTQLGMSAIGTGAFGGGGGGQMMGNEVQNSFQRMPGLSGLFSSRRQYVGPQAQFIAPTTTSNNGWSSMRKIG